MTKDQFITAIEAVSKENLTAGRVMAFLIAINEGSNPEMCLELMQAALGVSDEELDEATAVLARYGIGVTDEPQERVTA